jgi:hypothetical protein
MKNLETNCTTINIVVPVIAGVRISLAFLSGSDILGEADVSPKSDLYLSHYFGEGNICFGFVPEDEVT